MIELRPWASGDCAMLHKTVGDASLMLHLGGPESVEQIAARHRRFLDLSDEGAMFVIELQPSKASVGTIGFWTTSLQGELVYETGWFVLPEFQGHGYAAEAARAVVALAKAAGKYRSLHAFPSIANVASNRVCERAGFANQGECEVEYPQGRLMRCNAWRIELSEAEPFS